jgi:predicted Zn-dependent protease
MRPLSVLFRAACACAAFLVLSSCAISPVTGKPELMLVSQQQEIQLGKEAAPSLTWGYGGRYRDEELQRYLEPIVRRIWENSERPDLPFRFATLNTSVPNAFALPGYVAITRGLLAEFDNEAQFVAVMGHEVGHVAARHTAKALTRRTLQQLGLVLGGAVLADSGTRDVVLGVGALGSSLLLLKFSRDQELQADRLGVRYMAELGYDPRQAVQAHERLMVAVDDYLHRIGEKRREGTIIEALFSTHPRESVRKEEIRDMIGDLPPYQVTAPQGGTGRERFIERTRSLREVHQAYAPYDRAVKYYGEGKLREAEAELKKALATMEGQAPFHNLYGMLMLKRDSPEKARGYFERALALYPDYQPSVYGLGLVAMSQGRYRDALVHFDKSLKLFPAHAGTVLGMGKSHFKLGQYREALPYLESFASAYPRHPEVHGMLGLCYESTGRLREAVQSYQRQLEVAPENDMGALARERLAALGMTPS